MYNCIDHINAQIVLLLYAFTIGIWYNSAIEYASQEKKIAIKRHWLKGKYIFFFKTLVDEQPPTVMS